MKTSHKILAVLRDCPERTAVELARLLPGHSVHQISCALARLLDSKRIKITGAIHQISGNNKKHRTYKINDGV